MANVKQLVQGDILFVRLDIPHYTGKSTEIKRLETNVVAEGEKTGHKHILWGGFLYNSSSWGTCAFVGNEGGTVTHDEHHTLNLSPGEYRIVRQKHYNYEAEYKREVAERVVED